MAFPVSSSSVQQGLNQLSATAAGVLVPKALWRTLSSSSDSAPLVVVCSCCQEPRDRHELLVLPDCFRGHGTSSFICTNCHAYVETLLSAVEVKDSTLQAWKFQLLAPVNNFDFAMSRAKALFTSEDDINEISRMLPYIPKLVIDMSERGVTSLEFEEATVLIVDVSGYTALAEQLATFFGEGNVVGQASGAEALVTEGLNRYFEDLVKCVHSYGGDVIKFAGDALICLFSPSPDDDDEEEAVRSAARNAVFCAVTTSQTMTHTVQVTNSTSKLLTCHCGVATGNVIAWSVGDSERREVLLTGETIAIAGQALENAPSNGTAIDRRTYLLVSDWTVTSAIDGSDLKLKGNSGGSGQLNDKARKLLGNPHPALLPRASTVKSPSASFYLVDSITVQSFIPRGSTVSDTITSEEGQEKDDQSRVSLTPASLLTLVQRHLPRPARGPRLQNEMRRVTTVFTKLYNVGLTTNSVNLHDLFRECKRIVANLGGGLIRQFIVDDKGCVLISVFGVASYTADDDATRALTAAVRLAHELPVPSSSGVATGVVFVGVVGWPNVRCEFAVVGDSVNLAARLMSLACKSGEREVRCDEATSSVSTDAVEFEELESVLLKGKSQPTRVFVPSISLSTPRSSLTSLKSSVSFFERPKGGEDAQLCAGRDEEKEQILYFVQESRTNSKMHSGTPQSGGNILLISGKTGLGKTNLLRWAQHKLVLDDSIVVAPENSASLMSWVVAAADAVCKSGTGDPDGVIGLVSSKLHEGRYRAALSSIAIDKTATAKLDDGARHVQRQSFSQTSSSSAHQPMLRRAVSSRMSSSRTLMLDVSISSEAANNISIITSPRPGRGGPVSSNSDPANLVAAHFERTSHLGASILEMSAMSGSLQQRRHSSIPDILNEENIEQLVAWLLGLPTVPETLSGKVIRADEQNEQLRMRILEQLFFAFVRDLSLQRAHVVFVLDNADEASEAILRCCGAAMLDPNIIVLCTTKREDARITTWAGKRRCTIPLKPLEDEDIKEIVRDRFTFENCPDSVWRFVLSGSHGNPQLALEYFRALLRQQFITKSATNRMEYILSPGKSDEDLAKATPLEGSILNSFDTNLTTYEKDLIRLCSIICSTDHPHATIGATLLAHLQYSSKQGPKDVELVLNKLSNTLGNDDEAYLAKAESKDGEFVFANGIVRNVIYKTMTFAERSQIHQRLALWLQASCGWDLLAAPLIVHHLVAAGERRQAFDFLCSMCVLVLKEGPFGDAIVFLSQALSIAGSPQLRDVVDLVEIAKLKMALLIAQGAREGKLNPDELSTILTSALQQQGGRLSSTFRPILSSVPSLESMPLGGLTSELPTRANSSNAEMSAKTLAPSLDFPDNIQLVREVCFTEIWSALYITGDASMLIDAFDRLISSFSLTGYPTQRLFLRLLSRALSAPLRGRGRTKLDIGILERTVDVALQLAAPEIAGLGNLATALSLLLFKRPFAAERMARNALGKFRDISYVSRISDGGDSGNIDEKIAYYASVSNVHCMQLIAVCQTLCGGLSGAEQTLATCAALTDKLELVKMLAWTLCSQTIVRFKLTGRLLQDESTNNYFDWHSLSEIDSFIAWTASALNNQQECAWFAVKEETLKLIRSKRFYWLLGDCLEGAVYCGLVNRANWAIPLVEEMFNFARSSLNVVLPIAYRLEALVRAQRGEDVLALKAIRKAKRYARKYNLLFEAQLCDFIQHNVFCDHVAESELTRLNNDFQVFGCGPRFASDMRSTITQWINLEHLGRQALRDNRWSTAHQKQKSSFGFISAVTGCFPSKN